MIVPGIYADMTHRMKEYIAGRSVNPLVVTPNVTDRSDLRIFSSDGNVTIKAYVATRSLPIHLC
jgi:hypothetical protein